MVGGVPRPVGGVTTFVRRYVCQKGEEIAAIIDIYPENKEPLPTGCKEKLLIVNGALGLIFWSYFSRSATTDTSVFFNFSRPRACILLLLLRKRHREPWSLMLHHGSLVASSQLTRILFGMSMRRVDLVRFISPLQYDFYRSIGVEADKLVNDTSYYPPLDHIDNRDATLEIQGIQSRFKKFALISGFPDRLYNIDLAVQSFLDAAPRDVVLCVFIYGPGALRDQIVQFGEDAENIRVYDNKSEGYFNTFLKSSDLFFRLTRTDSVGIAVWDAEHWKVPIIASDVCERPKRANLVRLNRCPEELIDTIRKLLQ